MKKVEKKESKKVETKSNNSSKKVSKSKKKNKFVICLIVIVVLVIIIACVYKMILNRQKSRASESVEILIGAIQAGDKTTIEQYLKYPIDGSNEEEEDMEEDESYVENQENESYSNEANNSSNVNESSNGTNLLSDSETDINDDREMLRILTQNLTYNVTNVDANFKNATVTVEITNKNIGEVINATLIYAIQNAFNINNNEEESQKDYIKNLINSDSIKTTTTPVVFNLVKENGQWKIDVDKTELTNAVWPGLIETINRFSALQD